MLGLNFIQIVRYIVLGFLMARLVRAAPLHPYFYSGKQGQPTQNHPRPCNS